MSIDTINDLSPRVQYVALAAQTVFPYPFPIFADEDLVVYVDGALQTLDTDYQVSGEEDDTGGDVTFLSALVGGEIVTIYRDISIERTTDISQNGPWSSTAYNNEQDKIFLILQQLKSQLARSLRLPIVAEVDDADLELVVANFANMYLTLDADGKPTPAALSAQTMTQAVIGQLLHPRTPQEVALGITPVNFQYLPGNVDRYGTNTTPGTTDMTAAFNAAGKLAKNTGCEVVYGQTWPYLLTAPVDFTQDAGTDQYGFSVRNVGQVAAVTNNPPTYPSIIADHTGHVFDCSGAILIHWYGVSIGTAAGGSEPQTAIFAARNSSGSSCSHTWFNFSALGKFSKAVRYLYGIETNDAFADFLYNDSAVAGTSCEVLSSNNILGLSSTFITIATGVRSQRAVRRFGGTYINTSSNATADVWKLDQAENFYFTNNFVACPGRSVVFDDPTHGPSNYGHVVGMEVENGVEPTYAFCFGAASGTTTPVGWDITGSYLRADTRAIYAGANVVFSSFGIRDISEAASKGLEVVTRLEQSTVDRVSVLVINESKQNYLIGDTSNFTIATRTNDYWFDIGATNKTWTPNTGALSHGGVLSVNNLRIALVGSKMFFSFNMVDTVSLSCADNTSITGLPFAAAIQSADVTVTNGNTGASIGTGYVFGTTIKLPAISVGAGVNVTVSGSSFVS